MSSVERKKSLFGFACLGFVLLGVVGWFFFAIELGTINSIIITEIYFCFHRCKTDIRQNILIEHTETKDTSYFEYTKFLIVVQIEAEPVDFSFLYVLQLCV